MRRSAESSARPWHRPRTGALSGWQQTADGALALVILLDQFTRNAYRGSAAAFSGDAMAREVATGALDRGASIAHCRSRDAWFSTIRSNTARRWRTRNVRLGCFSGLATESPSEWREYIDSFLRYAWAHLEVIEQFGRFPHRNEALGRESTAAEREWLSTHGGF